jgi:hypothetical protein
MSIGLSGQMPKRPTVKSIGHFRGKIIPELNDGRNHPTDLSYWLALCWESYDISITREDPNLPELVSLMLDDLGGSFQDG